VNRRGVAAETLAASFLLSRGLVIAQRNYHCRFGEIDLIARDGTTLVFVEVRQRRSERYGGAAESITAAKRARLVAAARHYLARHGQVPACRFDVVLIRGAEPCIEWIRNAFDE
jgi:putative endonuclease